MKLGGNDSIVYDTLVVHPVRSWGNSALRFVSHQVQYVSELQLGGLSAHLNLSFTLPFTDTALLLVINSNISLTFVPQLRRQEPSSSAPPSAHNEPPAHVRDRPTQKSHSPHIDNQSNILHRSSNICHKVRSNELLFVHFAADKRVVPPASAASVKSELLI